MTQASGTRARGDLLLRVYAATISLVLTKGVRRVRSADIASAADTTESTLFRHFDGLDDVLQKTYDHCWRSVNSRIQDAAFDNPLPGTPTDQILSDMGALWSLRSTDQRLAATLAFLFMRRRAEIFANDSEESEEQQRFERRISSLCTKIVADKAAIVPGFNRDPRLLTQLLLNYAASVWLTWYCMPVGSDDLTEEPHDITEPEAQLGIIVLIERFLAGVDQREQESTWQPKNASL